MSEYDAGTALVVVDCQNDFADPEGSLYVEGAGDVLAEVNRQIIAAAAAGAPVVYTQDWHPETTPHFQKDGGTWPVHCVKDTWGAEFHPRLIVVGRSVKKGSNGEDGYSGFTMRDPETGEEMPTELDSVLKSLNTRRVVVVGLALDYCVKATALDASRLGYATIVPEDCTAAVNLEPDDDDAALDELQEAGIDVREAMS
ncbi:MAG TPA: isochorismatase family protein [Acidimicrobiia bacterium]|nr:isochorismatase family protein [Acidimicrobiia bacterium]